MSATATITQLRVPQTLTVVKPTTPARFDAFLEMVASTLAFNDPFGVASALTETVAVDVAYDALCAFVDEPVTNDHAIVREFAMALAKMMSTDPHSLAESIDVAHYVNQLSLQNDLPAFIEWNARERHARHTASLMFALIHKRQQSGDLSQQAAGADDLH